MQVKYKVKDEDKHVYDVNTLLYHKGFLYSGADDGKIMKWDDNLSKKCEVQAHPSSIYSLTAIEDTIYSCSNDGSVKSFTLDLTEKSVLITDQCEFWKLATSQGLLFAGDDQGLIRVFDKDKLISVYEILEPVKDMVIEENLVISAKDTDTIITEITKGSKVTFANRKQFPGRAPICLVGDAIVVADRSAKGITLYEKSKENYFKHIANVEDAHEMVINAIAGCINKDETIAYTAGWDKILKQWKITENSCKLIDSCKLDIVISTLKLKDTGIIFAAGEDGYIIRIDLN